MTFCGLGLNFALVFALGSAMYMKCLAFSGCSAYWNNVCVSLTQANMIYFMDNTRLVAKVIFLLGLN